MYELSKRLNLSLFVFFFCKQKTAYEMRISDWSSDVCSSDLRLHTDRDRLHAGGLSAGRAVRLRGDAADRRPRRPHSLLRRAGLAVLDGGAHPHGDGRPLALGPHARAGRLLLSRPLRGGGELAERAPRQPPATRPAPRSLPHPTRRP